MDKIFTKDITEKDRLRLIDYLMEIKNEDDIQIGYEGPVTVLLP